MGNSRDFAKFEDIRATFYDADAREVLCKYDAEQVSGNSGAGCVIMCSLYRLTDKLWRVNSFGSPCKGSVRDYAPIVTKLQALGFPRSVCLRNQVPAILESIQKQFKVDPALISATLGPPPSEDKDPESPHPE